MGLSLALTTARSSIQANAAQIAVASRNVAGASDPSYSRKIASVVTLNGGVRVAVGRASDAALYTRMIGATSDLAGRDALLNGLQTLQRTLGTTENGTSPAVRLDALGTALHSAANKPEDPVLLRGAVERARDLARSLAEGAAAVQAVRQEADGAMAESVARVNGLLGQFDLANRAVMTGTALGRDVTDDLDTRDRILASLSEEIGITTQVREGGDVAIYTDSGLPLFDRGPRRVSLAPTPALAAGVAGAAVMIEGVSVTGAGSPMPIQSGRLAGLSQLRDETAPAYGAQLDEIARGLVLAFRERDAGGTERAGLFTEAGSALLPAGPPATGLAAALRLNAAVDPQAGGSVDLLRDGGMAGAAFRSNPAGAGTNTAYPDRLRALAGALTQAQNFDPGPDLRGRASLKDFAASSVGWLEGRRKEASEAADAHATLLSRASEALSNATGVNTDDETAQTLKLEQAYAASARLIALIDEMLKTLINAV
ncbi:flagellar hook-associated protein FlgK [Methylobacterium oryzisoli]|uniref:flagellar hook-associated protein FlgK n=1 Tax=Methylobacterium oryzisoli TaxID=3385502 RepID=UPI0038915633